MLFTLDVWVKDHAVLDDDIASVYDYRAVPKAIDSVLSAGHIQLQETVAERIAAKLLAEGEKLQQKKQIRAAIKKYEAAFNADPLSDAAAAKYAYLLSLNDKTSAGVDKALAAYRAAIDQRPERTAAAGGPL